jgi:acyl carrier protein
MPTPDDVFGYVKELIAEMKDIEPGELNQETSIEQLGVDSLDLVEIQVNVKREYLVTLTPSMFESQIRTIGQLCAYVADTALTQEG